MEDNRIYFENNPWPEGHPIEELHWKAKVKNGDVWFDLHLKSADYYAERNIEDDEDTEYESDWAAPIVWDNYHSCTLSSNYWHDGGFRVCSLEEFSPAYIDGREFTVDTQPDAMEDWDDMAFHIYLLGHDAAACHKIKFVLDQTSGKFDLHWEGRIAQAYVGDYEFKHKFKANYRGLELPELKQ